MKNIPTSSYVPRPAHFKGELDIRQPPLLDKDKFVVVLDLKEANAITLREASFNDQQVIDTNTTSAAASSTSQNVQTGLESGNLPRHLVDALKQVQQQNTKGYYEVRAYVAVNLNKYPDLGQRCQVVDDYLYSKRNSDIVQTDELPAYLTEYRNKLIQLIGEANIGGERVSIKNEAVPLTLSRLNEIETKLGPLLSPRDQRSAPGLSDDLATAPLDCYRLTGGRGITPSYPIAGLPPGGQLAMRDTETHSLVMTTTLVYGDFLKAGITPASLHLSLTEITQQKKVLFDEGENARQDARLTPEKLRTLSIDRQACYTVAIELSYPLQTPIGKQDAGNALISATRAELSGRGNGHIYGYELPYLTGQLREQLNGKTPLLIDQVTIDVRPQRWPAQVEGLRKQPQYLSLGVPDAPVTTPGTTPQQAASNCQTKPIHTMTPNTATPASDAGEFTIPLQSLTGTRFSMEQLSNQLVNKLNTQQGMVNPQMADQVTKLLDGRKTDVLIMNDQTVGKLYVTNIPGKGLVLKQIDVQAHLNLKEGYLGHQFSTLDKANLERYGNMGRRVEMVSIGNKKPFQGYLGVDTDTKTLIVFRADKLHLPSTLLGVALDANQQQKLAEGKALKLDGLEKDGKVFSAYARVNAAKQKITFERIPPLQVRKAIAIRAKMEVKETTSVADQAPTPNTGQATQQQKAPSTKTAVNVAASQQSAAKVTTPPKPTSAGVVKPVREKTIREPSAPGTKATARKPPKTKLS